MSHFLMQMYSRPTINTECLSCKVSSEVPVPKNKKCRIHE